MKLLEQGARSLGIHLSASQLDRFERYYRELAEWNQRANLTAITGYEETQVRHFLDSLTACLAFRRDDGTGPGSLPGVGRMVDVGSGAGFPGLPLKLAFPDIELHLIESVGKKAAFLEHVSGLLELEGVSVHSGRAEALARQPDLRESFDLALVRGVARLSLLLEYTLPFCRVGGRHGGAQARRAGRGAGRGGTCLVGVGRARHRSVSRNPRWPDRQSSGGGFRKDCPHARPIPKTGWDSGQAPAMTSPRRCP